MNSWSFIVWYLIVILPCGVIIASWCESLFMYLWVCTQSVVYTAQPHACTCTCTIIICQNAGFAITTTVSSSSLPILKVTISTTADILKRLSDWETDLTTVSYHHAVVQVLLVMLQVQKSWLWIYCQCKQEFTTYVHSQHLLCMS